MLYDMQGIKEEKQIKQDIILEEWLGCKKEWLNCKMNALIDKIDEIRLNKVSKFDDGDFDEEAYLKRGIETAPAFMKLFEEALNEL